MNSYKIKESFKKIKGNSGGGGLKDEQKKSLLSIARINIEILKKLLNSLENITPNIFGSYICKFEYENIPSKSSRFLFGKKYRSLEEVKQRGIYLNHDNDVLVTFLFYELDLESINWMKQNLRMIIEAKSIEDINEKCYLNFLKNIINNKEKKIILKSISSSNSLTNFKGIRIIRLLPIDSAIALLKEEGVLNEENFNDQLMIAFLTSEEINLIIQKDLNIFISSQEKPVFSVNLLDIDKESPVIDIPPSENDEVIGIIDSGNSLNSPFSDFILSNEDHREYKGVHSGHDFSHGSAVSSLIIANDQMNPSSPDGLGTFKIKHFELLQPNNGSAASVSFDHMIKKIKEIVINNKDIKVWNLSFGSIKTPYSRMISDLGKVLDILSVENDVIFVVASGNERAKYGNKSLNQPADSINALSVGSSQRKGKKIKYSDYSSIGPILHYEKPEISHFGGPENIDGSNLVAYSPNYESRIMGTSFAAPRVSRMIAHYISNGLTPKEAKVKAISLAIRETPANKASSFGYIGSKNPALQLSLTFKVTDKNPVYFDIELPKGYEKIKIVTTHFVDQHHNFGEEYSIHSIDPKLIYYDKNLNNPEHKHKAAVPSKVSFNNNYLGEKVLRFEGGKYFNTIQWVGKKINIESAKERLKAKGVLEEDIKLAIRIKKLDLFETIIDQEKEVSFVVNIYGDDINISDFEDMNNQLIEIHQDIEI